MGSALCQELFDKYEIIGLDLVKLRSIESSKLKGFIECDITVRGKTIAEITSVKPDIAIHAAAYTDVDGCEANPQKANEVNALGTQNVAQACKDCKCLLVYISTDFVFDGEKKTAYAEEDSAHPINTYGQSKLDGERFIQSTLKKFIIVRSSWLFGRGGGNFVDAILEKAKTKKTIEVVTDQYGSPTYAQDLAQAISKLMALTKEIDGTVHITNSGSCSRYEFALAIKESANLDANIVPVSSEQYYNHARRPKMSILENRRYQELAGEKLRHWKEALKEYLTEVKNECAKIRG